MKVLADWPYVATQTEVQKEIDAEHNAGYVTFMLCSPTSIMPVSGDGARKSGAHGPGRRK